MDADSIPRDIRKIPMPNWEARGVTAKISGKWSVFFSGANDDPINLVEPHNSRVEFLTNPMTLRPASVISNMSRSTQRKIKARSSEPSSGFIDSYTLRRMAQQKELEQQKLVIEPDFVLKNSEKSPVPKKDDNRTVFSAYERKRIVPIVSSQPVNVAHVPCQERVRSRCTNRVHLYMNQPFGKRVYGFWRE